MVSIALVIAVILLWQETSRLKGRIAEMERGDPRLHALELRIDLLQRSRVADGGAVERTAAEDAGRIRSAPAPVEAIEATVAMRATRIAPSVGEEPVVAEAARTQANPWRAKPEAASDASDRKAPSTPPHMEAHEEVPSRSGGFEDLFGRRLPIWAGGITLAIAGLLILKLSIESGMLSPLVRVVLSMVFGSGLIASAEFFRAMDADGRDPRVPQALSGAGIAVLYGSVLMASLGYGMIGQGAAFVLAALITAGAGALSLRFGTASALLGLVGGMIAPTLAGVTAQSVPLVAVYVALVSVGMGLVARHREWRVLGGLSMAGGLLWSALLLGHSQDPLASVSLTVMIAAVAVGLPMVLGSGWAWFRLAGAVVASIQIAALVSIGGFGALQWGLYGLLSALVVWISLQDETLRRLPIIGLATSAMLLLSWNDATWSGLISVLLGMMVVYGVPSVAAAWRNGDVEAAWFASATAAIAAGVPMWRFIDRGAAPAAIAAFCSTLLLAAAFIGWRSEDRTEDSRFSSMLGTAATIAFLAASRAIGFDGMAFSAAVVSAALIAFAGIAGDRRLRWWGSALAATSFLGASGVLADWFATGMRSLSGESFDASNAPALFDVVTMLVPSTMAIGFAIRTLDLEERIRSMLLLVFGVMATVAAHVVWKRTVGSLFAMEGGFLDYLDRTVWEMGLAAVAVGFAWKGRNAIANAFGAASLLHFAVFSVIIESPLWQTEFVGPVLVMSFLLAGVLVQASRRTWVGEEADLFRSVGTIVLIVAYAFLQLRQLVNGELTLVSGTTGTEEILRSLLSVSLGIGFLAWGLIRGDRTWRIASLGMMLFAAIKIFVFDASGLDGIARIATFVALGFSLIGIGWVYSRYLPERRSEVPSF